MPQIKNKEDQNCRLVVINDLELEEKGYLPISNQSYAKIVEVEGHKRMVEVRLIVRKDDFEAEEILEDEREEYELNLEKWKVKGKINKD